MSAAPPSPPADHAVLVAAHPAHELRLFAWLSRARPEVHVLATGSRSGDDCARLETTRSNLIALGAAPGAVFGAFYDRDFYAHVMAGRIEPLHTLVDTLADSLSAAGARTVVTDGWQGYSATHDLTNLIARTAAAEAAARTGRPMRVLEYTLADEAAHRLIPMGPVVETLVLQPGELDAKHAAIAGYPDIDGELGGLDAATLHDWLAREQLHAPRPLDYLLMRQAAPPAYERFGLERVAAGLYAEALGWRHVEVAARSLAARHERAAARPAEEAAA